MQSDWESISSKNNGVEPEKTLSLLRTLVDLTVGSLLILDMDIYTQYVTVIKVKDDAQQSN